MILTNLKLKNFRNYDKLDLNFNDKINIFIGNNAQGKTNILESIYVLSLTKSHRTNKDMFLIKKDSLFTKIIGTVKEDKETTYEILINENGKKVSINNDPLKKVSEYISKINVILFSPDDLEIIKGTPGERRSFFNVSISGFNNNYVRYLSEYNKILKSRNEYLKNNEIINKDYLDILTNKLIDLNIKIYNEREEYVSKINKYLKYIYKDISGKDNIYLTYDSFIEDKNNIKEELEDKFNLIYNTEINQRVTLLGVHKDDFSIYIDDIKINNYGSQGQHRMAVLCLKLSEIKIYEEEYNKKPILLLDDIFSELDKEKKTNIIKYIDNGLQVFITSTDLNSIDKKITKNSNIYKIASGKVIEGD